MALSQWLSRVSFWTFSGPLVPPSSLHFSFLSVYLQILQPFPQFSFWCCIFVTYLHYSFLRAFSNMSQSFRNTVYCNSLIALLWINQLVGLKACVLILMPCQLKKNKLQCIPYIHLFIFVYWSSSFHICNYWKYLCKQYTVSYIFIYQDAFSAVCDFENHRHQAILTMKTC